jgi:Putative DNA-binding domain
MSDRSLEALERLVADAIGSDADVSSRGDVAGRMGAVIAPGARPLDASARLGIYREQFWLRHLANLGDDFPTLAWVTGEAAFRDIAVAYLKRHPPRTWDLQRLGADLPSFVARLAPWGSDALALDAVRLDWAFMEAFDAPDAGPLDPEALARVPEEAWPAAQIALHPALRTMVLAHPVHDLRDAVRSREARERPRAAKTHLVVWRDRRCLLHATELEPMAFELLGELAGGAPLGGACEAVARAHSLEGSDLGARVGAWFQRWTADGWLSAVRL